VDSGQWLVARGGEDESIDGFFYSCWPLVTDHFTNKNTPGELKAHPVRELWFGYPRKRGRIERAIF